jgi:hypothetical protein
MFKLPCFYYLPFQFSNFLDYRIFIGQKIEAAGRARGDGEKGVCFFWGVDEGVDEFSFF